MSGATTGKTNTPHYKVLLVDDDVFSRRLLERYMRSMPVSVTHAEDGLQALAQIVADPPDLVLLDVNMPVMDGLETLREIRSSPRFARLPVVSVSSNTEKELVMRLVELGLSGFLVKPLKPSDTIARLKSALQHVLPSTEEGQPAASSLASRPGLLLVDTDPDFREFARPLLQARFELTEAESGVGGLQAAMRLHPAVIWVSETVQMPGAWAVARQLRESPARPRPRVFLLRDGAGAAPAPDPLFDGVIVRRLTAEAFERELREAGLAEAPVQEAVRVLVRERLLPELVGATRQVLGVMTSQEVEPLQAGWTPRDGQLDCTVPLLLDGGGTAVRVRLLADAAGAAGLAAGAGAGTPAELMCRLVDAVAGRVRGSLSEHGLRFEQGEAAATSRLEPAEWDVAAAFRTAGGADVCVALRVGNA